MEVIISPCSPKGTIKAINSKSQAHRLLICAAFSDRPSSVECVTRSRDILATVDCLNALGAEIHFLDSGYKVLPIAKIPDAPYLDCGESGSTLRFLLPVAAALGARAKIYMGGRLNERPMGPLIEELVRHGCSIKKTSDRILEVDGKLEGGDFMIPGNISSQFISGLLLALPLTEEGGSIRVHGKLESSGYVDMTLDALKLAGVEVGVSDGEGEKGYLEKKSQEGSGSDDADTSPGDFEGSATKRLNQNDKSEVRTYTIPPGQKYHLPMKVSTEGDWSNTAFWLAMGALSEGSICCMGLNHSSSQKDKMIVGLLRRFGAIVSTSPGVAISKRKDLHGIDIDVSDIPDLVPVLAVVAAAAKGTTKIYGGLRLRAKESDRLKSVHALIAGLGGDIEETNDGLIINGTGKLKGGTVDSFNDHRIAMAGATAALVSQNPVIIKTAQAVEKSYPLFWQDFKALGGQFKIIEDR